MKVDVYIIYDREAIITFGWELLQKGLDTLESLSKGDANKEIILNDLLAGNSLLWLGFVDGKYVGFLTTKFDFRGVNRKDLFVEEAYIEKGSPPEVFEEALKKIEEFAKVNNCQRIRALTNREGLLRKLKGWEEGYFEVFKEVEKNG